MAVEELNLNRRDVGTSPFGGVKAGDLRGDLGTPAAGQCDPGALNSFCDRFLNPRRDAARQIILQGIAAGEFAPDLDPDVAMDILYGPIYYRLMVQHLPLDDAFAKCFPHQAMISILNL